MRHQQTSPRQNPPVVTTGQWLDAQCRRPQSMQSVGFPHLTPCSIPKQLGVAGRRQVSESP
ncbi:Uncharacterised protein [Vibrio cholerae]|nr:Uncharacterised protein [Vibrio cholerae]CSB90786.1 Uncharacterised protein [Vibrio cholerae]